MSHHIAIFRGINIYIHKTPENLPKKPKNSLKTPLKKTKYFWKLSKKFGEKIRENSKSPKYLRTFWGDFYSP
jgi:hypothetical protein